MALNPEKQNYEAVKSILNDLFANAKTKSSDAMIAFAKRNQSLSENLSTYYAELCILVKQAFPSLSNEEQARQVATRFKEGIISNEIRMYSLLRN